MNSAAFSISGYAVTWSAVLLAVILSAWMVMAVQSLLSRAPLPKKRGWRSSEKRLLIGTAILLAGWMVVFEGASLLQWKQDGAVQAGALGTPRSQGSCALIQQDMSAQDVQAKLGKPDEIRPNDEIRGPGSVMWIYQGSRCAVHLFENRVEFIE